LIDQNLATNGNGNATTTSTKGKSGYQFAAAPGTNAVTQFLTTATPTSASSGSKYYCAVEDGAVSGFGWWHYSDCQHSLLHH
jgi:hypothetical protein